MRCHQPRVYGPRVPSDANHHFRQIAEYRASGTDDRTPADGHSGRDEYVRGHPHFIFDNDGKCLYVETRGSIVVRAGAQIALLRHDGILPDCNSCKAIEDRIVADPGVIADLQFPGVGDLDAGAHDDAFTDLRAEATQQPSPEAI